MVSEDLGGFVPAELVDLVMELEHKIRGEHSDPTMDHRAMVGHMMPMLESEGVPTQQGAVSEFMITEILHWEDEFLAMAGSPRSIRP